MSRTPWGDATELRERRLAPGRGTPREEVERNQRERLFAAMVATMAEKGYEATRVADVLMLAGVSRKAFYSYFADKEECFTEAVAAIVDRTFAVLQERVGSDGGESVRGEKGLEFLLWATSEQPSAARAIVIEAFSAGPAAREKLERTIIDLEWTAAGLMSEEHGGQRVQRELARAVLGGIAGTVHRVLREGREQELPGLAAPLWRWASSLTPLPGLLPERRERSGRRRAAEVPFEARVPTERILRGFAAAVAEHGYAEVPVAAIASHGKVSLSTFYDLFDGKREALGAALALVETQLLAAVLPAAREAEELGSTVAASFQAAMEYFAAEPELAHLWIVDVMAAGPEAVARRDRLDGELFATVSALAGSGLGELDGIAVEATMGAVHSLLYERVRAEGGPGALPALAPMLTYVATVPFLGAEAAWKAAGGE
jgi:AcrR family transcriptional regulator